MTEPANEKNNQKGIDINEALSILAQRDSHAHDHCSHNKSEMVKNMGQKIDLFATSEGVVDTAQKAQAEEQQIQQERKERLEKIQQELQSLSNAQLIQAVFQAQENRVKAYRDYER